MNLDPGMYLTRPQAARFLGLSPGTLANWAAQERGPRFKVGYDRRARYKVADLIAYIEAGQTRGEGAQQNP